LKDEFNKVVSHNEHHLGQIEKALEAYIALASGYIRA
jgi:hypothetical protein